MPTTSYPARLSRPATTEESTPPDMATTTRARAGSPERSRSGAISIVPVKGPWRRSTFPGLAPAALPGIAPDHSEGGGRFKVNCTWEPPEIQPIRREILAISFPQLSRFLRRRGYGEAGSGQVLCESRMTEQMRARVKYVIGPDGSPLTIADLPPRNTKRWVIRRKAEVVAAVCGGLLSLEEACARYTLTVEEFLSWQQSIDSHGLAGLRTTRIQQYRQ